VEVGESVAKKRKPTNWNAAKKRQQERKQPRQLKPEEIERIKGGLKTIMEGIKTMSEKRNSTENFKKFGPKPVEDEAANFYEGGGSLTKPKRQVIHGDRIQWYWLIGECTVIASLVTKDSPYTEDVGTHGSRAGAWTVDVLGPSGGALFALPGETARVVGEAILSAVGWEFAWRDFYKDYLGEFEEQKEEPSSMRNLSAEVIPIYNKEEAE
jgi:hypothetical protein